MIRLIWSDSITISCELQSAEFDEPGNGDVWESVDMKKPLHPIGYYINNREEMIRQVFTVIHGERLKKMLPPVLKDIDLDELKADCLIHLVGMSSKRIKAILEGRELDVSSDESDSDVDLAVNSNNFNSLGGASVSNTNDLMVVQQKKLKASNKSTGVSHSNNSSQILEDGCSIISGDDMLEIGLTNSDLCDDFFESNDDSKSPKNKRKKLKRSNLPSQQTPMPVVASTTHTSPQQSDSAVAELSVKGVNDTIKVDGEGNSDTKGKTLLEILELEMRARAIRALLKRDDSPTQSPLSSSQQKQKLCNNNGDTITETQSEIIDLTMANDSAELVTTATKESVNEVMQTKTTEDVSDNEENISKEKDKCLEIRDNSVLSKIRNTEENTQPFMIEDSEESDKPVNNVKIDDNDKNIACNSWAERWLEKKSKDVKRLVSTSKMCTTIRNKMKKSNIRNKKALFYETVNKDKNDLLTKTMPCEFKGSIDEYNMLTKCIVDKEEPQQPDKISIHQSSSVSDKTNDESEETQNTTTSENN
ncbi:uncharacterized protein LOC142324834 isoform X2 [Lycorma delicatula]|uniref:uncharacterized protein LOC142324834 isoform X2 n=1 Tax=Lycorma delicatula TaxID=130591 RepID=UPI003F5144F1